MHSTTSLTRHREVYHAWDIAGRDPQWLVIGRFYIVCEKKTKQFFINQFNKAKK